MHRSLTLVIVLASTVGFASNIFADSHGGPEGDLPAIGAYVPTPISGGPLSVGGPLTVTPYHSRPGATAKIFLDFDGDVTNDWSGYTPGTTPAYDVDGDESTFTAAEHANILETWQRVAEKYSPFNIDVTTQDPGNGNDRETVRVVIGGTGSWFGLSGGVAWPGSFYNGYPNTVFVFPKNLANGVPKYTAEASAHEAGHSFGLQHQSAYSGTTKTAEYSDGDGVTKAPTMGKSYHTARGLWWNGPTPSGYNILQDDLSIITSGTNGFDYRADDYGNTKLTAAPLTLDGGGNLSGGGVIERMTDVDYFNFSTLGGAYVFNVNNYSLGGMLDVSTWLYDSNGVLINSATTVALSETLAGYLDSGSYSLVVGGAGNYGDIGQYTLSGAIAGAVVPEPATLSLLAVGILALRRRR